MPSVLLEGATATDSNKVRGIYGGQNDGLHLGGFTNIDEMGISNNLWNFMMGPLGIKSFLDVGCGKGLSTKYFLDNGAEVLCVEGSHDGVMNSYLPQDKIVEHDYSRGPWWPERTYDACWSVEFLEHVGRQFMGNYHQTFRKCALIFATASGWGGWHHVEVHEEWWWNAKLEAAGFQYNSKLTHLARRQANNDREAFVERTGNQSTMGQHLRGLMVFINPLIASMDEHSHIFSGHGCYSGVISNRDGGKSCEGLEKLPERYKPLLDCSRKEQKSSKSRKNSRSKDIEAITWNCKNNKNEVI
eukprot:CAMPEP_0119036722 /NCGR_PEP_ID=MMETSP1177-20130426/4628_1 /TAXON_ID=2985 /ORGANISM="Ochromonas sp, Strain CCMP1899" /LENGTH=300 /DNA_ID=CAMNT_0006996993 /DNA_START=253 /DNA_END=1155 /DNA_ORIENTATION=-